MAKLIFFIGVILIIEVSCQHIIYPTYRPPPTSSPPIRTVRQAGEAVLEGDQVQEYAPVNFEAFEDTYDGTAVLGYNQRYARSLDSPSAKLGGGSHKTSGGSRDTGATHPGYNRRNARSVDSPSAKRYGRDIPEFGYAPLPPPFNPNGPPKPSPYNPNDYNPFETRTLYGRRIRDISLQQAFKKPTHRDVIIPNWNPNARIKPWQTIGVRRN